MWYDIPNNHSSHAFLAAGPSNWREVLSFANFTQWFLVVSSPFLLAIFAFIAIAYDIAAARYLQGDESFLTGIEAPIAVFAAVVAIFLHVLFVLSLRDTIRLLVYLRRGRA